MSRQTICDGCDEIIVGKTPSGIQRNGEVHQVSIGITGEEFHDATYNYDLCIGCKMSLVANHLPIKWPRKINND